MRKPKIGTLLKVVGDEDKESESLSIAVVDRYFEDMETKSVDTLGYIFLVHAHDNRKHDGVSAKAIILKSLATGELTIWGEHTWQYNPWFEVVKGEEK